MKMIEEKDCYTVCTGFPASNKGWWGIQRWAVAESFWSHVRGQLWRISMPKGPCSRRHAASARWQCWAEYLPLLLHVLPLIKLKRETTIKKAREVKVPSWIGKRGEENGSVQGTWRITSSGTIIIFVGLLNKFHQPQVSIAFTFYVNSDTFSEPQLF